MVQFLCLTVYVVINRVQNYLCKYQLGLFSAYKQYRWHIIATVNCFYSHAAGPNYTQMASAAHCLEQQEAPLPRRAQCVRRA